jgi:hypothetical protein
MTARLNLQAQHGEDLIKPLHLGVGAMHDISSFEYVDASNMKVNSQSHRKSDGDRIVLINSMYYVGSYTVANKTDDTFNVATLFEKTEEEAKWMNAQDLTGYSAEAKVWKGNKLVADFVATIEDDTGGHVQLFLTDTQINAMDLGNYLWDLFLIDGSGIRRRYLEGDFIVTGRGY